MPAFKPSQFIKEESTSSKSAEPDQVFWISEAGGLTQFGSFVEVLQPGSRSAKKHWHTAEDELVYVLAGEITLIEGDNESRLCAGDAATFRANVPVGHYLENRSEFPTRCLIVGTRAPIDQITYPDHGGVLHRDRLQPDDIWLDLNGHPASSPHST